MSRMTGWHSGPTLGGLKLTSRYTQKPLAASDHCVAVIRTCERCAERYVATPREPAHDCHEAHVDAAFRGL
jgi:hypothetical protein